MNFDYVRLLFATQVMLYHCGIIQTKFNLFNGQFAVRGFFCLSGFLITQSYLNSKSFEDYFVKRAARLYPPIVAMVVAMALLGLQVGSDWRFFRAILGLLSFHEMSGLPEGGGTSGGFVHGAFWTVVIEFQFYLYLPFVIMALRKSERLTLVFLAVVYFGAHYLPRYLPLNLPWNLQQMIPSFTYRQGIFRYARFFIPGILIGYYAPKVYLRREFPLVVVASALVYWLLAYREGQVLIHVFPFAVMGLVLGLGRLFSFFGEKSIFGDVSYGVYLYHFPVMAVFLMNGYSLNLVLSWTVVMLTTLLAFLSWNYLEKPILTKVRTR